MDHNAVCHIPVDLSRVPLRHKTDGSWPFIWVVLVAKAHVGKTVYIHTLTAISSDAAGRTQDVLKAIISRVSALYERRSIVWNAS
jgi:hypothetical protein